MRVLIFLLILTIAHYTQQQTPPQPFNMEAVVQECVKSTNADPTHIENAFKEGKFIDDKNFKCFIKCVFVKMGDMTEDGKLNLETMKSQAPPGVTPAQAQTIIDTCKDSTGADPCEIAFNAAKCMVDEAVKIFGSG